MVNGTVFLKEMSFMNRRNDSMEEEAVLQSARVVWMGIKLNKECNSGGESPATLYERSRKHQMTKTEKALKSGQYETWKNSLNTTNMKEFKNQDDNVNTKLAEKRKEQQRQKKVSDSQTDEGKLKKETRSSRRKLNKNYKEADKKFYDEISKLLSTDPDN